MLRDANLLEGSTTSVCAEEAGVWDGQTVMGAAKRYPKYIEATSRPNADAPTKDDFMARIKNGEVFETALMTKGACSECFGDGKLSRMMGNRDCEKCRGTGNSILRWRLKW